MSLGVREMVFAFVGSVGAHEVQGEELLAGQVAFVVKFHGRHEVRLPVLDGLLRGTRRVRGG